MTKLNTLEQIKKAESEADQIVKKTQEEVSRDWSEAKNKGEEKLAHLKIELAPQIKEINMRADREIKQIQENLKEETRQKIQVLKNISPQKKEKAACLVINRIIKT